MNITIKTLLTLHFICLPFFLYSTEIIIKVPEKFRNTNLPLPPFPNEAINRLEEVEFFQELNLSEVRSINQKKIEYIHYFNILDFTLEKRYMLIGGFSLSLEKEKMHTSLFPVIRSNHFGIFTNATNDSLLNNSFISYVDYRLPVYIGGKVFFNTDKYESTLKYESYNHNLNMTIGFEEENPYGTLLYKNRYKINPHIDINFNDELDFIAGLGSSLLYSRFTFGVSSFSELYQPFIKYDFLHKKLNLNINTDIDQNNLNYRLLAGYKHNRYYLIGAGYNLTHDLNPVNPELVLSSNTLWGKKIIALSSEYIKGQFSFINNYINTIIFFEFFNADNYEVSAEIIYNNILIESGYIKNSDSFEVAISCSYKVVL